MCSGLVGRSVTGRFGPESFRPWVVSALGRFGLGRFGPGSFRRPVYIESCACVVKNVFKCSFEYLSVVHHSRRQI